MLNILINAYTISPNHGSESGVGWNWIVRISKYCIVHIITESEFKNEIEEALSKLEHKDNIHFFYNDIGEKVRKMCWNQGDYRFYFFYRKWQKRTYKIALEIIAQNKIDIIHQLNMIGYREPGYLWKIKNIPFVWGPIDGFVFVRYSFLSSLGLKGAIFYSLKNILNFTQALTNKRVKKAIKRANLLIAASSNSQKSIKNFYNKDSIIISETGCNINIQDYQKSSLDFNEKFNILWVGRFIPTKMLGLALDTIGRLKHLKEIRLHIVGNGISENSITQYQEYAKKIGVNQLCVWHGKVPREKVDIIMKSSDLFFFTSIIEATSTVIMEAIANKLPILCFDTCGHGKIVNEKMGIKIPVTTPKNAKKQFADIITDLYNHPEKLDKLSNTTNEDIYELSWDAKIARMIELYKSIIKK